MNVPDLIDKAKWNNENPPFLRIVVGSLLYISISSNKPRKREEGIFQENWIPHKRQPNGKNREPFLLPAAVAVAAEPSTMAVEKPEVEIFKPRTDTRSYRRIVLPNALEVLLISDPDTDKVKIPLSSFLCPRKHFPWFLNRQLSPLFSLSPEEGFTFCHWFWTFVWFWGLLGGGFHGCKGRLF